EDDDNKSKNVNKTIEHGSHHPFKVEAKIDIPTYDGTIDAEKLDSWLDQLATYFTIYGFRSSDKWSYMVVVGGDDGGWNLLEESDVEIHNVSIEHENDDGVHEQRGVYWQHDPYHRDDEDQEIVEMIAELNHPNEIGEEVVEKEEIMDEGLVGGDESDFHNDDTEKAFEVDAYPFHVLFVVVVVGHGLAVVGDNSGGGGDGDGGWVVVGGWRWFYWGTCCCSDIK
ncbi:hypothetical protein Tco_1239906, partial [Tanacetum coccineum]